MRSPVLTKPPLVPALLGGLSLLMVAGLTFLACGGAKNRAADEFWSDEQSRETKPLRETEELNKSSQAFESDAGVAEAMLGVRHDLMIAPTTKHQAKCSCLAVEMGEASDAKFQWQNGVPEIGPSAMVVAVSARGVDCPGGAGDESQRRASISAVDRDGPDVIIEIEEIPEGRPIASGAVVPKPGPGGSLLVHSKSPKLPYAKPAAGQHACRVR